MGPSSMNELAGASPIVPPKLLHFQALALVHNPASTGLFIA
jgi:hypothetical protein